MKNYECYNELTYWDKFLSEKRLATVGFCEDNTQETVIVNASIIAAEMQIFSSQWLCLPNCYAVLGFLQYVYFPTVFYHSMYGNDELKILPTAMLKIKLLCWNCYKSCSSCGNCRKENA